MNQNLKLFYHDLKKCFDDKKTILVITFLTFLTLVINISFCIILDDEGTSLLNQLKLVSKIDDLNILVSYCINIYSFVIFTAYPFILGIGIVSYLKEFGELELMMLFPINRKQFFIEKILCIFIISINFCWISILLNSCILSAFSDNSFSVNIKILFYAIIVLPVWILFLSFMTVIISSLSKDTKDANQKCMLVPFVLFAAIQLVLTLKINIFAYKIILLPLSLGFLGIVSLFNFLKKLTIEKILYN